MPQRTNIGSFQHMKSLNRSLILNMIREKGPISRAEIAKQTKLTPPTVSNIVKELLDTKIIIEKSQGVSHGGRKPTMLAINYQYFHIIGLDVGPKNIKIVLTDLNANVLDQQQKDLPVGIDEQGLLDLMKNSIQHIINDAKHNNKNLIGIGIGMHGMVNAEEGISLFAPNLNLHNIPIKEDLEATFKMIVKVENDARAMALGESWFGNGKGAHSMVAVNVGRGIGSGIIINGQLFHGEHHIGGEIGHMTIDIDGPQCTCGNYGCLQALASGPVIEQQAIKALAMGHESMLSHMANNNLDHINGALIHQAAKQHDDLAKNVLKEAGKYLGVAITNVIHTINPDRIIIGGGVAKSGAFVLNSIQEAIHQRSLTEEAKQTDILPAKLGDQSTAIGAASLLLVELFSTKTTP